MTIRSSPAPMIWSPFEMKTRAASCGCVSDNYSTAARTFGFSSFVSEKAVKPIVAGGDQIAKMRAMARAVTGQDRKRRG
jgi:hypothetical protein